MLDRLKALYHVPRLRARLSLIASLSILIALSAWEVWSSTSPEVKLLFFGIGSGSAALLTWDLAKTRSLERKRARIESGIRQLSSGESD